MVVCVIEVTFLAGIARNTYFSPIFKHKTYRWVKIFFYICKNNQSITTMIPPIYSPNPDRYTNGMKYRRCGRSGILLPEISLGLWHNFGAVDPLKRSFEIAHYALDHGITHFDLANNYGPPYGSAEETFGQIMKKSFQP